jgi:hypothetical protein
MARGQCNCGAVQFEVDGDLGGIYVCHCSICRRSTGSNGIAVVVVPKDRLRWVCGQSRIASWRKPGADWEKWFCTACGSPVPGENDAASVFIPVGGLTEGSESLKVAHHIYVGSKAHWDVIGDDGQQHLAALGG